MGNCTLRISTRRTTQRCSRSEKRLSHIRRKHNRRRLLKSSTKSWSHRGPSSARTLSLNNGSLKNKKRSKRLRKSLNRNGRRRPRWCSIRSKTMTRSGVFCKVRTRTLLYRHQLGMSITVMLVANKLWMLYSLMSTVAETMGLSKMVSWQWSMMIGSF